jgi:hypothetical protein
MNAETYFSLAILGALAVGVLLVIHGTIVKNNWGVTLRPVQCPHCATVLGRVRMPTSAGQAVWGGYTCPTCRGELDKWGRPIS